MINDWIVRLAPWILGLIALGFLLIARLVIRDLIIMRSGHYYVVREDARKRALRSAGLAALVLVAGVSFGLYARALSQRPRISTSIPGSTPTISAHRPTATPTFTNMPSPTLVPSPSSRPSTTTPVLTPTPSVELPPPLLTVTSLPSAVPALPNARLGAITFAAGAKEVKCPAPPSGAGQTEFEAGTPKICAYFLVYNMARNTMWTAVWYKEGKYVAGDPLLWTDAPDGVGVAFYAEPGRQPGRWELRLYIEGRLQSIGAFIVKPPPGSATPQPAPASATSQPTISSATPEPALTPTPNGTPAN